MSLFDIFFIFVFFFYLKSVQSCFAEYAELLHKKEFKKKLKVSGTYSPDDGMFLWGKFYNKFKTHSCLSLI